MAQKPSPIPGAYAAADQLLNETQASERLGLAVQTLRNWRVTGGPKGRSAPPAIPFVKLGRTVRYRASDLERFISASTATSTSGVRP